MASIEIENVFRKDGKCCMKFHPENKYLYIGGDEGIVKQYSYGLNDDNTKLKLAHSFEDADERHDEPINQIAFNSTGDYMAYCCEDGEVTFVRHPTCSNPRILSKYDNSVSSIHFNPDKYSFLLAMSTDDGKIKLVNALKAIEDHYEFNCNEGDGVRFIKWIKYEPLKYRASREKYLCIAECNGNFSIWKIFSGLIFSQTEKDKDKKAIKYKQFKNVFPKIKGGDINQRLAFDATNNAKLIAISGNTNVKILDMSKQEIRETTMIHNGTINFCIFNKYAQEIDSNNYILATSDVKGGVKIWNIKYDETQNILEPQEIDTFISNDPICDLEWKTKYELYGCSMKGNVYKWVYDDHDATKNEENTNTNNLNTVKKIEPSINQQTEQKEQNDDGSMDVDQDDDEEANQEPASVSIEQPQKVEQEQKEIVAEEANNILNVNQDSNENQEDEKEKKEEEEAKPISKSPNKTKTDTNFEDDSDEDFDVDMGQEPSPKKKILRRSFIDDEESPSPPTQINAHLNQSKSPEAKTKESNMDNKASLQADLAAAAEMFGDDGDAFDDDMVNKDEPTPKKTIKPKSSIFSKDLFEDEEAEDLGVETKKEKEEQRMMDQDTGEDLNDFIVDPDENGNGDKPSAMDDTFHDSPRRGRRDKVIYQEKVHKPFTNGATKYDEDGQRYLLFNQIGAVIVRKQDVSSNPMEMNNIITLTNAKYSYEMEFFDKSRFSRAVVFKSDHHYTSCDVNSFGLLLGSTPQQKKDIKINDDYNMEETKDENEDIMKESIIRYKPISRNKEYRSFSSEKDCEWQHTLPMGEECIAVGLTQKYALIATNKRYLRILSIGGLQTHQIIPLAKTVINIASNRNNMIVVTFEDLSFMVIDLDDTSDRPYEGKMGVSNNDCSLSRVFVIGDGLKNWKIITIDTANTVCMWTNNTMNNAVLLDLHEYLNKKYPNNDETMEISNNMRPKGLWPVYFDSEEKSLMVIELKYLETPIPSQSTNDGFVLEDYKISIPLLNMGKNELDPMTQEEIVMFGNREEEIMRKDLLFKFNDNGTKNDNKEKEHNKQKLKDYLMLFSHACKSNKSVIAYDIAVHFLSTEKALSNAIKIAMHHQMPLLAEQLTKFAKDKLETADSKKTNNNNIQRNRNNMNMKIRKPTRTLKRPTAKLTANNINIHNHLMENVTNTMEKTKLAGTKRKQNPCQNDEEMGNIEPPKKRNPFSSNNGGGNNNMNKNRNNNNSIFRC